MFARRLWRIITAVLDYRLTVGKMLAASLVIVVMLGCWTHFTSTSSKYVVGYGVLTVTPGYKKLSGRVLYSSYRRFGEIWMIPEYAYPIHDDAEVRLQTVELNGAGRSTFCLYDQNGSGFVVLIDRGKDSVYFPGQEATEEWRQIFQELKAEHPAIPLGSLEESQINNKVLSQLH